MHLPTTEFDTNPPLNDANFYENRVMDSDAFGRYLRPQDTSHDVHIIYEIKAINGEFNDALKTLPTYNNITDKFMQAIKNPVSIREDEYEYEFLSMHEIDNQSESADSTGEPPVARANPKGYILHREVLFGHRLSTFDYLDESSDYNDYMKSVTLELFILNYVKHPNILASLSTQQPGGGRFRMMFLPHIPLSTIACFAWTQYPDRPNIFEGYNTPKYVIKCVAEGRQYLRETWHLSMRDITLNDICISPNGNVRIGSFKTVKESRGESIGSVVAELGALFLAMVRRWVDLGENPGFDFYYLNLKFENIISSALDGAPVNLEEAGETWTFGSEDPSEIAEIVNICSSLSCTLPEVISHLSSVPDCSEAIAERIKNFEITYFANPEYEIKLPEPPPTLQLHDPANKAQINFKFDMRNNYWGSLRDAVVNPSNPHEILKAAINAVGYAEGWTFDPQNLHLSCDILTNYATMIKLIKELNALYIVERRQSVSYHAFYRIEPVPLGYNARRLLVITAILTFVRWVEIEFRPPTTHWGLYDVATDESIPY